LMFKYSLPRRRAAANPHCDVVAHDDVPHLLDACRASIGRNHAAVGERHGQASRLAQTVAPQPWARIGVVCTFTSGRGSNHTMLVSTTTTLILADWSKLLTEHGAIVDGALHALRGPVLSIPMWPSGFREQLLSLCPSTWTSSRRSALGRSPSESFKSTEMAVSRQLAS
jgi:hypothetical protein